MPNTTPEVKIIKVLLLICATTVPRGDCRVETARDVLQGPDAYDVASCGFQSQAYLAGSAVGRRIRDGEYVKILCSTSAIGKGNVG